MQAVGADAAVRIEGRYLLLRSPDDPVVSHPIDAAAVHAVQLRIEELLQKVEQGTLHPEPADKQGCAECGFRRLCRIYGG
jgi:hypothetical protein